MNAWTEHLKQALDPRKDSCTTQVNIILLAATLQVTRFAMHEPGMAFKFTHVVQAVLQCICFVQHGPHNLDDVLHGDNDSATSDVHLPTL